MTIDVVSVAGRRVLIVEDDFNIAITIAMDLEAQGGEIIGPAGTVREGLSLVEANDRIDGALLDINLHGKMVYPIVDALRARNVPMIFMTGYDRRSLDPRYADVPCMQKPVSVKRLIQALFR